MVAGIFCLGAASVVLLCGAGAVPVENFAPQGAMQTDLNAGGHSVTNAATIAATNVVVSGTLTAANLGSAATNSASAFAPASGSTSYIQSGNVSASAQGALANATAGAGNRLVTGSTDASLDLTLAPAGTASSLILNPEADVDVPNVMLPLGPGGNVLFVGDSLTQGVGIQTQAPFRSWSGQWHSYPDFFAEMAAGLNATPYNFGVSGDKLQDAINRFTGISSGTVTTGTVTATTAGTSTVTVGALTGITLGMGVASSSGDIPFGTTITGTSTGTIVLSAAATGTHTNESLYFCNASSFGSGASFNSAGWLVSNFVAGVPTWVILNVGTNDYAVGGLAYTGSATTGSGTITAMSMISWSPASNLASSTGYNAWGVTPTGTISIGTVTSATGTSTVVSNPSAVTSSMTSFRFSPPITSWTGSYTAFVNSLVGYGDAVMVTTIMPFGNYDTQAEQYFGFNCNRLLMNAWITSAYSTGTVSGVTFADVGNIPQLQYGTSYDFYRNGTAYPHLNAQGYQVEATFLATQFAANYPSAMQGFINPFTGSNSAGAGYGGTGLPRAWLPGGLISTDGYGSSYGNSLVPANSVGTYAFGSYGQKITLDGLNSITNLGFLTSLGPVTVGSGGTELYTDHLIVFGGTGVMGEFAGSNGTSNVMELSGYSSGANKICGYGVYQNTTQKWLFGMDSASNGVLDGCIKDVATGNVALSFSPTTDNANFCGALNTAAVQTTVNGSTAGTAVFSEPLAGASFKEVVIFLNNLSGTATYTFPAAFANTPVVMNSDAAVTTVSTTTVTVTGSGTTRVAILEGY